jgi:ribosomal protein S18 acetylase RimI-like enzyme
MLIRPATPDDVPQILPMVASICALHQEWDAARFRTVDHPERMYDGWLRERAADGRSVFLVAEREGRIVAYVVCTIEPEIPIYWTPACGWVHDLWVDPQYRNEGLARQMTLHVIERFKQLGVTQLRLQTAAANDASRKLFQSCGFRVATIEMLMEIDHARAGKEGLSAED